MSQLAGAPVRLQFMRWDEHGWDNYGPAQMTDIRGGVDANGKIVAFEFTALRHPVLLDAADAAAGRLGDASRARDRTRRAPTRTISGTQYNIPNRRVIGKTLPLAEQLLQDVVAAGAARPADGVRRRADDRRARVRGEDGPVRVPAQEHRHDDDRPDVGAALEERARRRRRSSRTGSRRSPRRTSRAADVVKGRGHRARQLRGHEAVLRRRHRGEQEHRQDRREARCTSRRSPASPSTRRQREQEEGAAMQGASRVRSYEQVAFDTKRVTSLDWVTYPILRFKDAPKIHVHGLTRTDVPDPARPGLADDGLGRAAARRSRRRSPTRSSTRRACASARRR